MLRIASMLLGLTLFALSWTTVLAGDPVEGRGLYNDHCAGCHGANGRAIVAGTPDLAGVGATKIKVKPDMQLMATIAGGKNIMPGFEGRLSKKEMLDIIAYIRTFF